MIHQEASKICSNLGGDLVTIKSRQELHSLNEAVTWPYTPVWIKSSSGLDVSSKIRCVRSKCCQFVYENQVYEDLCSFKHSVICLLPHPVSSVMQSIINRGLMNETLKLSILTNFDLKSEMKSAQNWTRETAEFTTQMQRLIANLTEEKAKVSTLAAEVTELRIQSTKWETLHDEVVSSNQQLKKLAENSATNFYLATISLLISIGVVTGLAFNHFLQRQTQRKQDNSNEYHLAEQNDVTVAS